MEFTMFSNDEKHSGIKRDKHEWGLMEQHHDDDHNFSNLCKHCGLHWWWDDLEEPELPCDPDHIIGYTVRVRRYSNKEDWRAGKFTVRDFAHCPRFDIERLFDSLIDAAERIVFNVEQHAEELERLGYLSDAARAKSSHEEYYRMTSATEAEPQISND
jgi:hypothetical protein